ncbi:MAG: diguanylate cyclase [Nitriliruptoraceae bacterium]|nr:diguanylate cyclase [Nitriliruptoraceae bacterium]
MIRSRLEHQQSGRFWLQHVWLGVGTSATVLAVVALHLLTTPELRGHDVLPIALAFGVVVTVAAACLPWRRIIASRSPAPYLQVWSATLVVLIVLLAALDGGPSSPMTALLVLPLVYAAMAYPVRSIIAIGALTVAGLVVIAFSAPPVVVGESAIRVAILLLTAVMGALISRNHQRAIARTEELAARLETLASVDGLTGCLNHRGFHERLEAEAARSIREGRPLALVHLDLDRFKAINDTYGHPTGDEVLATVGATLNGLARRSDAVGRLGGEEFAILLPQVDAAEAARIAERARHAIRDQDAPVPVTVSIGVATLADAGGRPDRLVREADAALYAAKRAGRDRVVAASA